MTTIDGGGVIQRHSVHTLVFRSLKRTHEMFLSDFESQPPEIFTEGFVNYLFILFDNCI